MMCRVVEIMLIGMWLCLENWTLLFFMQVHWTWIPAFVYPSRGCSLYYIYTKHGSTINRMAAGSRLPRSIASRGIFTPFY